MKSLAPALVLLIFSSCARSIAPSPASSSRSNGQGTTHITIVGTSDIHGWIEPQEKQLDDGRSIRFGGSAIFGGYVNLLREKNPGGVLLVDAGDMFQGTLVVNLSEGAAIVAAHNALGYDAAAVGNHEFDYGPVGPGATAVNDGEDPVGALRLRATEAKFPFLARNVYGRNNEKRPLFPNEDGFVIVERNGLKIGIVGFSTPSTPNATSSSSIADLRFAPLAPEAKQAALELKAYGADLLVALVHAGGQCSLFENPISLKGCNREAEIFQMLESLPPGLFDAVVAGHTHSLVGHFVNGMPVIESAAFGLRFGIIDLEIDLKTRRPIASATKIRSGVPICERVFSDTNDCNPKNATQAPITQAMFEGKPVIADSSISAVIAPFAKQVAKMQKRPLGVKVPRALTRNRNGESLLGNALTDALREMEKTDIALINSGGLRSDLPKGQLTYGALFEVFPFENYIATLELTGAEIIALVEAMFASGQSIPLVSGLKISVSRCGPNARVTDIGFQDGRDFERNRIYRLSTNSFLATGGDGLNRVLDSVPPNRKSLGNQRQQNMLDALASWLEKKNGSFESKLDGRLVIENSSCGNR